MILQIIGYVISFVIVGAICGTTAYLYGWEKGWDDSKHLIHTTLDALSDEGIILVVREMAKKFREEGAKDRIAEEAEKEV